MEKSKTEFLGVNFILKDGSSQFVEPHKEVKEYIENILNEAEYYIQYGDNEPISVDEGEFNSESLNQIFTFSRIEIKTEGNKQTLHIRYEVDGEFFD